jgi:hypothetical protein
MKRQTLNYLILVFLLCGCTREGIQPSVADKDADLARLAGIELPAVDWAALEVEAALDWRTELVQFRDGAVVELPAGSHDGLAAAIAQAGEGGTVIVKAGEHTESGAVIISHRVRILGEPGAVLIVHTEHGQPLPSQPALHVLNAEQVVIWGLEIRPATAPGGIAILLENAPRTIVRDNKIYNHQVSILVEHGDRSRILNNIVVASPAWLDGQIENVFGIVVINGDLVTIYNNDVSFAIFGIWPCDQKGHCLRNNTHENLIGIILCKMPAAYPLPGGNITGSELPATGWLTYENTSTGNFDVGILVIDGANRNFVANNNLSNNARHDIELTTDTERFGFLTPKAHDNIVLARSGQSVKDCGLNNRVIGGDMVDTNVDICF